MRCGQWSLPLHVIQISLFYVISNLLIAYKIQIINILVNKKEICFQELALQLHFNKPRKQIIYFLIYLKL